MRKKELNIDIDMVVTLHNSGLGSRNIAKELNCCRDDIRQILNDLNIRHPKSLQHNLTTLTARVKIIETSGCWEWQGGKFKTGYGRVTCQGRPKRVHRLVYELINGPVSCAFQVCHICDNRICCNPDHLFIGTNRDNMIDCTLKGRNPSARLSKEDVLTIREKSAAGVNINDLALKYNVSSGHLRKIIKKEKWGFI